MESNHRDGPTGHKYRTVRTFDVRHHSAIKYNDSIFTCMYHIIHNYNAWFAVTVIAVIKPNDLDIICFKGSRVVYGFWRDKQTNTYILPYAQTQTNDNIIHTYRPKHTYMHIIDSHVIHLFIHPFFLIQLEETIDYLERELSFREQYVYSIHNIIIYMFVVYMYIR